MGEAHSNLPFNKNTIAGGFVHSGKDWSFVRISFVFTCVRYTQAVLRLLMVSHEIGSYLHPSLGLCASTSLEVYSIKDDL